MRQKLSRAAALLPLTLLLPLMLLGTHQRNQPQGMTRGSERAEQVRFLRRDLQETAQHAAYWQAVARRSRGGNPAAARRARLYGEKLTWQTKHLAAQRR